jgi:ribosomal-protein-alanine N-acetyltransferase
VIERKRFLEFERLTTNQLILKEINKKCVNDVFELYSDYEVIKYTDNNQHTSVEDSEKLIDYFQAGYKKQELIYWGISLKSSDKIIGALGFYHIDWKHKFTATGNLLAKKYWNQGIMSEAQSAIVNFGFNKMKLHRIEAQIFVGNIPSYKMFEYLNFKREGILRENFLIEGKFEDSYMYSMLKSEFESMNFKM